MVRLGRLGSIFIGFLTQIYFSTAYESGSLCMYQAMTFYESFGLEVAHKIIRRRLGSRVYIFTNLTQIWNDQKRKQPYDQIFMLIIGRTVKMYNLFEKLEEVNFQTGFELIAEQIIDGNKPYLDWASRYVPAYDAANETTVAENVFLPDTNEAFTFRENFINKKYGTLPPNYTMFAGLDLESNSNNTLERMQNVNIKPYQDLLERIKKGERFPPDATFPGLELEKDDNLRAISEEEEAPIREQLRSIREQRMNDARRNFELRQRRYYEERNVPVPEMYERDRILPSYYERNDPREFYERNLAAADYERNAPRELYERYMPRHYERDAPRGFYGRDNRRHIQRNGERNAHRAFYQMDISAADYEQNVRPGFYRNDISANYKQNAKKKWYGRNAARNGERNIHPDYYERTILRDGERNAHRRFYERDMPAEDYEQNAPRGFYRSDASANKQQSYDRDAMRNVDRGANMARNPYKSGQRPGQEKQAAAAQRRTDVEVDELRNGERGANTARNPHKSGQRSDQAKQVTAARRRSLMEVIHNFIFRDTTDSEVTNVKKTEVGRSDRKIRKQMRARQVTEVYQPYQVEDEINEIDELENAQPDIVKHYIYVQQVENRNVENGQEARYERKPARASRGSKARKNEKQAARARQTIRANARKVFGGRNIRANTKYNYKRRADKPINIHDNPMVIQKGNEGINNYHKPGMVENAAIDGNQQQHMYVRQHITPQNELKDIGNFHPHDEDVQQIDKLPAVHANQLNMRRARPVNNPYNLPVQHAVANRLPNVGIAMKNFEKIKLSRKVKNAPRVRKSRARGIKKPIYRPQPVVARKSKIVSFVPQYNVDLEGHTTVHFIDVVQYHYEPRQNMLMLQ